MKALAKIVAVLLISVSAFGQFNHHLEIGGSNYMGLGLTTEYQFKLYNPQQTTKQQQRFYISPKLGVGHIFVWDHALTLQFGLGFGKVFKNDHQLEFNSNMSYLTTSPFAKKSEISSSFYSFMPDNNGSYLWYTGFDYKIRKKKVIYTVGVGALTMIERYWKQDHYTINDFIPMAKIGFGI